MSHLGAKQTINYDLMFRESLRISVTNLHEAITPMEEKDRFKKFQEAEKKRYRAEQQRLELNETIVNSLSILIIPGLR